MRRIKTKILIISAGLSLFAFCIHTNLYAQSSQEEIAALENAMAENVQLQENQAFTQIQNTTDEQEIITVQRSTPIITTKDLKKGREYIVPEFFLDAAGTFTGILSEAAIEVFTLGDGDSFADITSSVISCGTSSLLKDIFGREYYYYPGLGKFHRVASTPLDDYDISYYCEVWKNERGDKLIVHPYVPDYPVFLYPNESNTFVDNIRIGTSSESIPNF